MALNFDLTKIKNLDELWLTNEKGEEVMDPITNALIWGTISVGLHTIEEKNIDEWMFRLEVLALTDGHLLIKTKEDGTKEGYNPTRDEVERRIGLWTNAFPDKKRTKFMSDVSRFLAEEASSRIRLRTEKEAVKNR